MEITVFKYENTIIRTDCVDGEPWFCGKDVCEVLGYSNSNKAIKDHCRQDGVTISYLTDGVGRQRETSFINEPNLYRLIMRSKMQAAEAFENWVVTEVLPTIRKNGGYITKNKLAELFTNPSSIPDFLRNMAETIDSLNAQVRDRDLKIDGLETEKAILAPKAAFADAVSVSGTCILVRDLAKLIKQKGIDMGEKRLFAWLRDNGYLCTQKASWNMPTQRAMELGLFEIKETAVQNPSGEPILRKTAKITGKGQIYFIRKFFPNGDMDIQAY